MKKRYFFLFVLLTIPTVCVHAVNTPPDRGRLTVDSLRLLHEGDSVRLHLELDAGAAALGNRDRVVVAPVLRDGEHSAHLPQVVVLGRNRYKQARRAEALAGRRTKEQNNVYAVLRGYGHAAGRRTDYTAAVPYETWMEDACLGFEQQVTGRGMHALMLEGMAGVTALALPRKSTAQPVPVVPQVPDAAPAPESSVVRRRNCSALFTVCFAQGSYALRESSGANARMLDGLCRTLDSLLDDPDVSDLCLTLRGYASPEGGTAWNERLSGLRVRSVERYLAAHVSHAAHSLRIASDGGGEYWDGLRAALAERPFAERDAVLTVLDNEPAGPLRKRELMRLKGGAVWAALLRELFPALRIAEVRVDYILTEIPDDLSAADPASCEDSGPTKSDAE